MKSHHSLIPAYLSVAFISFSLQFGGGFSSGRQLVEFFLQYGLIGLITPIISQGIIFIVLYYAYKYALLHKVFDYREWANSFYHPYEKIMSNVFEVFYNIVLLMATSVALSTAGSVLNSLGLNYVLSTLIVAIFIFFFTIFGASFVRKASTAVSIVTIISILVLFLPNIIVSWSNILSNINSLNLIDGFWPGAGKCILYGSLQVSGIAAFLAHSEVFENLNQIKKSISLGFAINSSIIFIAVLGIFSITNINLTNDTLPTLTLAENGIMPSVMIPLVSFLIFIGSTFAGINLIFGNVSKITYWLGKGEPQEIYQAKYRKRSIIVSSSYIIASWLVAQFGLIAIIKHGYTINGIGGMFIVAIPVIIRGLIIRKKDII